MHSDLREKINSAIKFLEHCDRLLDEGKIVKLDEFEGDVMKLCAKIQAQGREEAKIYLADLKTIMDKLEFLEEKMRQRKIAIIEELEGLNASHKAASAYWKTPKNPGDNNK